MVKSLNKTGAKITKQLKTVIISGWDYYHYYYRCCCYFAWLTEGSHFVLNWTKTARQVTALLYLSLWARPPQCRRGAVPQVGPQGAPLLLGSVILSDATKPSCPSLSLL